MNIRTAYSPVFKRIILVVFMCMISISSFPAHSATEEDDDKAGWEYHRGPSGAFEVRFPRAFKQKIKSLRLDKKDVIYSSEIVATVGENQDPRKNKVFLISVDQTFGDPISTKMVKALLKADLTRYLRSIKRSGGVLRSESDINERGVRGKELLITFNEGPNKQGMRVKIMYTDVSKIQQVLSGPASSVYAYKSNDFFESLRAYNGRPKQEGSLEEEWEKHVSPLGISTLTVPQAQKPFMDAPLQFQNSNRIEKGMMVITDPILGYKTYYVYYGYEMDKNMDADDIRTLLYSQHVAKYGSSVTRESIKLKIKKQPDKTIVYTKMYVNPPPSAPYSDTIYLQAQFKGKYVIVQEVRGSKGHVLSPLMKSIVSLIDFHPDKAGQTPEQIKEQRESKKKQAQAGEETEEPEMDPFEDMGDDEDSSAADEAADDEAADDENSDENSDTAEETPEPESEPAQEETP